MPLRRAVKWALLGVAALVLIALGVLLTAPWWVNQDSVRQKIERALAQATGGSAQFQRIDVQFLPLPGATLSDLRLSMPGLLELHAKDASVEVAPLPLLLGDVRLRTVRVDAPQVQVQLPKGSEEPFSIEQAEAQLRAGLQSLLQLAPHLIGVVEGGSIELRGADGAKLRAQNVQLTVRTTRKEVEVELSAAGELWSRIALNARLGAADLAGAGQLEVQGLQAHALGTWVGSEADWPLAEVAVEARASWTMRGLTNVDAKLSGSAPAVVVKVAGTELALGASAVDGRARLLDGAVQVTVERLSVESPHATLSGTLDVNDTGVALDLRAQDADIGAVQKTLDVLAEKVPALKRVPVRGEAGVIEALQLRAAGAGFGTLFGWATLEASGRVTGAQLLIPDYSLRVQEVQGQISLHEGTLAFEQVQGRLAKSRLRDGRAALQPALTPMPLRIEGMLDADLAEARTVLRNVLPNPDVRRELARIEQLQGSAQVHLILEGTNRDVKVQVDASAIRASGRYAAIPFPLRIDDGRIRYTGDSVAWEGLKGALGASTVSRASGTLGLRGTYLLHAGRTDAVLHVAELFRWLDRYGAKARLRERARATAGTAAVSVVNLQGDPRKPQTLRYEVIVTPQQLMGEVLEPFPARLVLHGGRIVVTEASVRPQSLGVSMLDAALTVSGEVRDYRTGVRALSGSARGTLGPQAMRWIYERADYPKRWSLTAPVTVMSSEFQWQAVGAISARGIVAFPNGPQVGFAVRVGHEEVDALSFHVRDAVSDAKFSVRLGERMQASFQGLLAGRTVDQIFEDPRVVIGELRGDLQAEVDVDRPTQSKVTGALRGTVIPVLLDLPVPLTIERFSVRVRGDALVLESATLTSGEDRVELSGDIERSPNGYEVDVDVRGDSVTLPESLFAAKDEEKRTDKRRPLGRWWRVFDIPVHGRIRVDLGRLRAQRFEIAPLKATGRHSNGRIDLKIQQAALCGISLVGEVTVTAQPRDIAVQATLTAHNAPVAQSIYCLSAKHVQATGTFDLDGSFSTRGSAKQLQKNLRGTYTFSARDGRIQKADTLTRILTFVNLTEVALGQMTDPGAGGMAYSSFTNKGTIEGTTVILAETVLNADRVTLVGTGRFDYADRSVQAHVLVAPIKMVTRVFRVIPILRRMFGGTLIAIPVQVSGTLDNPIILPLSPQAVAQRLIGIVGNTLKLPFELFSFIPGAATQPPPPPKAP